MWGLPESAGSRDMAHSSLGQREAFAPAAWNGVVYKDGHKDSSGFHSTSESKSSKPTPLVGKRASCSKHRLCGNETGAHKLPQTTQHTAQRKGAGSVFGWLPVIHQNRLRRD